MSKGRFQRIQQCLQPANNPLLTCCNLLCMICELIKAFYIHMEAVFDPSWIKCLDGLMVVFMNKYSPNRMCVKCKPYPFGNEYNTIDCCLSKIAFQVELVKTEKHHPKDTPFSMPELEGTSQRLYPFVASLQQIWGSYCVCLLYSGFGQMETLLEWENKGLIGRTVSRRKVLVGLLGLMQKMCWHTCRGKHQLPSSEKGIFSQVSNYSSLICCYGG